MAPLAGLALDALLPAVKAAIEKIVGTIPDPAARENARREAEQALFTAIIASSSQQAEINKVEAENPSLFVAGWRPSIGWVCSAALAYQFIGRPILTGLGVPNLPPMDGSLMELVIAMLGLGAMRTFEKMRGITR